MSNACLSLFCNLNFTHFHCRCFAIFIHTALHGKLHVVSHPKVPSVTLHIPTWGSIYYKQSSLSPINREYQVSSGFHLYLLLSTWDVFKSIIQICVMQSVAVYIIYIQIYFRMTRYSVNNKFENMLSIYLEGKRIATKHLSRTPDQDLSLDPSEYEETTTLHCDMLH
jgi:hypothetical protein